MFYLLNYSSPNAFHHFLGVFTHFTNGFSESFQLLYIHTNGSTKAMWFYFFSHGILYWFTLKKKQEELVWNLNRSLCKSCFSFWLRLWVIQGFCCFVSSYTFPQILLVYITQRHVMWTTQAQADMVKINSWMWDFFFLLPPFHLFLFALISLLTFLSWKPCKVIVSILIDRERYTDRCLNCLFQQLSCCERRTDWND